jgi:hypothetical protein
MRYFIAAFSGKCLFFEGGSGLVEYLPPHDANPLNRLTYSKQAENLSVGKTKNKYPPAKPEVLRLLAPQRGLTAIAKSKPRNREDYERQTPGTVKL